MDALRDGIASQHRTLKPSHTLKRITIIIILLHHDYLRNNHRQIRIHLLKRTANLVNLMNARLISSTMHRQITHEIPSTNWKIAHTHLECPITGNDIIPIIG